MSIFKKIFNRQAVRGEIGYFGLGEWWLSTFDEEQRTFFKHAYTYFGIGIDSHDSPLTGGEISSLSHSSVYTLTGMIGALRKQPRYLHLAWLILQEAEIRKDGTALDLHYLYQTTIEVAYAQRNEHPEALDLAIEACQKQIAIAAQSAKMFKNEISEAERQRTFGAQLPAHVGYTQLCIIYEKEKRYSEVIQLAHKAKKEGWAGDWDKRIARCQKRLQK
ncbi:MAG: hypothetical protein KF893_18600 [Caldilineaceae bacterium]|nr:hypothetical protein [Caldilineaceae bacterium]